MRVGCLTYVSGSGLVPFDGQMHPPFTDVRDRYRWMITYIEPIITKDNE